VICTSFDYMAKCKAYLENGNTVTIIAECEPEGSETQPPEL